MQLILELSQGLQLLILGLYHYKKGKRSKSVAERKDMVKISELRVFLLI
jgi:hypothetical protein